MSPRYLYVYILKCSNDTYYTGVTNNLERRLLEHQSGISRNSYTSLYRPVTLVYYTQFTDFRLAIEWEKRIKRWSKKKKEALIQENWDTLQDLSKCKNESVAIPKAAHSSRLRSN